MSEPVPAASRPGSSTSPSIGPPSPGASISRNAPVMGDPSSVAVAAKLPALASTLTPWAGTCRRLAARVASTARPPPMAISGISGPSTAPKTRVPQRREDDAGKLSRGRRATNGEAVRR